MKKIERLKHIYNILKLNKLSLESILLSINEYEKLSKRQLQRDIKELNVLLRENEIINVYRDSKRLKIYHIIDSDKNKNYYRKNKSLDIKIIRKTNFFESKFMVKNEDTIRKIETHIIENDSILIKQLNYDSTGDNHLFTQRIIYFKPIELLLHRGSIYLGGFNIRKKNIQFFEINQIKEFEVLKNKLKNLEINDFYESELNSRFGISKNIDDKIYTIKLEFSSVTGNFIMNHFWHNSQSFKVKKGKVIMTLKCGINRELIGWIFYWMYNVKIIEPPILIDYYQKTLDEINILNSNNHPLVYRNIFNKKRNNS